MFDTWFAGTQRLSMMSCCWLAVLLAHGFSQTTGAIADEPADRAIRGIDLDGKSHWLGENPGCQGVVLVFLSTDCPISNRYLPVLNELVGKDRAKPTIRVFGVISSPHISREEALAHSEKFKPQFPILFDASGELREQLAPTHTPHAFLLSPRGATLYNGSIDDRFAAINNAKLTVTKNYLKDAIQSLLKHEPISVARTTPVGCPVEVVAVSSGDAKVTYNRDIAPILHFHCSICHRPGEAGPFPLLTYQHAVKHALQIQNVTTARIMPPWKPEPGFGRFQEERSLSARQNELIAEWVKAGTPEGPAADKPTPPVFTTGWQLGEPDLILKMPHAFALAAAGDDVHQHFVLPTELTRDRMVEAIEFRPGNAAVVHHAAFYLDVSDAAKKLEDAEPDVGYGGGPGPQFYSYGNLRNWVPGTRPQRLPAGFGQPLRKGTDIMVEIHYQRTGKPETDQSSLGIHFAPTKSKQIVLEMKIMDSTLAIPAGAARFHQHVSYTLPAKTILFDVTPHLHNLGREARAVAHLPDGEIHPLIWIKDWDFNWQGQYTFLEPLRLPAGTKIECDFYFDNTAANPRNPFTPPQHVYWGEQAKEEMAMFQFLYTCDTIRDLQASHKLQLEHRMQDRKPDTLPQPPATDSVTP